MHDFIELDIFNRRKSTENESNKFVFPDELEIVEGDARALLAGEASTAPPAEAVPGTLRAVAEFARRHGVAAAVAPPRETPPLASAAPETPPRRAWWRRW